MTGSISPPTASGNIHAILVSREVANADSVYLVSWSLSDGSLVEPGVEICVVETSKAAVTVEAKYPGYLRHCVAAGQEVPVGGVMGYITARADIPLPLIPGVEESVGQREVKISAKARQMIEEFGLDIGIFSGKGFIRERDVLEVVASRGLAGGKRGDPRGPSKIEPLGPVQRRVAKMMEQGAATIPAAYLDRVIDLAPVRVAAREATQASKILVSPVDLLVAAVAHACTQFPAFNSSVTGDYKLQSFKRINVGVAVNVEMDLYVVVLKDVSTKSFAEIAKELRTLEYLVQRRRLSIEHLTGGTITVTSMIGQGIHQFRPILYPGQTAIVGISDPRPGSDWASLTLGFDHRVANGSYAAAFLAAVERRLRGDRQGS